MESKKLSPGQAAWSVYGAKPVSGFAAVQLEFAAASFIAAAVAESLVSSTCASTCTAACAVVHP